MSGRSRREGRERPLGEVGRGTQGNGETINAENPERSLCPSVIFSDWRRESSLCDISSPFLLACASGATRRARGGGLFRCCQNHTFAARMCGRAAFLLSFLRKVSFSFPTTAKSERQSNFSRFAGFLSPLRRRGGNALRPHRCNARVPEGGRGRPEFVGYFALLKCLLLRPPRRFG